MQAELESQSPFIVLQHGPRAARRLALGGAGHVWPRSAQGHTTSRQRREIFSD
jgi:hypothetical protein